MNGNPSELYDLIQQTIHNYWIKLGELHYLEIGTQDGGSLLSAMETKHVALGIGIDTWGDKYGGTGRGGPSFVISKLGPLSRNVVLITGDSNFVLPMMAHKFDVILVDGDHSQEGCKSDLKNCLPLLSENGVMLVDDTDHPAHSYLRVTAKEFAGQNLLSIKFHPNHFGVAELRRTIA